MNKNAPKGNKYTREWLEDQLFNKQKSAVDIANEIGVSSTAIYDACKRYGVKRRSRSDAARLASGFQKLGEKNWLENKYLIEGLTTYEIAHLIGCNEEAVRKSLIRLKIPRRSKGTRYSIPQVRNKEWLFRQYIQLNKSQRQIAEELDCAETVINKWVKLHEIHKDTRWSGNDLKVTKSIRSTTQYAHWRKQVLQRDFHKCQNCSKTKNLQAHHIKSFAHHKELRFSLKNGQTLCQSCHRKIHTSQWLTAKTKIG